MSMFFMSSMRDEIEEIENRTSICEPEHNDNTEKWKKLFKLAKALGGTNLTWNKSENDYNASRVRDFLDAKLNMENCFNLSSDEIDNLIQTYGEVK